MADTSKKRRQYTATDVRTGVKLVREQNFTIYAASKATGVPWSTLKDYLNRVNPEEMPKLGRPFALSSEMEQKILNHIINMQELGFGVTVYQIRELAYKAAKQEDREKYLNNKNEIVSWWWWKSFKERYGLTLRVAENLSAYRASMANPVMISDFYTKLDNLLERLNIKDCPEQIWNCDETGLNFVTTKGRVIASVGKRYIYNRTYAERGENHTMLGCICADGTWIPPLVIFKGVRWSDNLKTDAMPNSITKLSKKGWITSEIFLEWFKFFISAIPEKRPVVLLMDSHSSHITPEIINLAKENSIFLLTFPAHNTHILQPLDVGVYKSLKHHWNESVKQYMRTNPTEKPDRTKFHGILNPAYFAAFSSNNIKNSFKKCGICPFNDNAVNSTALAPSKLTESPAPSSPSIHEERINDRTEENQSDAAFLEQPSTSSLFVVPQPSAKKKTRKRTNDSSARCLNDCLDQQSSLELNPTRVTARRASRSLHTSGEATDRTGEVNQPAAEEDPNTSGSCVPQVSSSATKKSRKRTKRRQSSSAPSSSDPQRDDGDDDWICSVCDGRFSDDVKNKNGRNWIQCSYCIQPYHNVCLNVAPDEDEAYFRCDDCLSALV